jgi:L-amino acid N-acyltransferase YncA
MSNNAFPKTVAVNGAKLNFRLMEAKDRYTILNFAQGLTEAELSFMRRDITQPDIVDEWVRDIEAGRAVTILVEDGGRLVAYGTLYFSQLFWSRHLAELRVMVSSPYRNRGVGSALTRELLKLASAYPFDKLLAYMAVEDKAAQKMAESLGFKPEALLTDWIKTRDDRTHDLLIMAASLADAR